MDWRSFGMFSRSCTKNTNLTNLQQEKFFYRFSDEMYCQFSTITKWNRTNRQLAGRYISGCETLDQSVGQLHSTWFGAMEILGFVVEVSMTGHPVFQILQPFVFYFSVYIWIWFIETTAGRISPHTALRGRCSLKYGEIMTARGKQNMSFVNSSLVHSQYKT